MSDRVRLTINDREVQAERGASLLETVRRMGIEIPTLCYNEELSSYGACRLCLVEIFRGDHSRLVVSCVHPVEEDLVVRTDTDRVMRTRRVVAELLLARSPNSEKIQQIAREMGVEEARFQQEDNDCILCGLCVRTCREVVGVEALGFSQRGSKREVTTPFNEPSQVCIACGACAYICPTGYIKLEDKDGVRKIWGKEFKLRKCQECGNHFAPEFQLKYIQEKWNIPRENLLLCPTCHG
ncbi:MAG: (2Fe-2S)-binding protein [Deltaproteobacteria bacterium]|nr:MAG: (2Fe-2S)-binding protein [Deltaproteobacteria bacterium]